MMLKLVSEVRIRNLTTECLPDCLTIILPLREWVHFIGLFWGVPEWEDGIDQAPRPQSARSLGSRV